MSPTQIVIDQPFYPAGCTLGEGPLYDPATETLHFVDIAEKKVFHLDIRDLSLVTEEFSDPVSCVALRNDGPGLACAARKGFALLEGDSSLKYISEPLHLEEIAHVRFNDGGCDSKGRFFAGTIYSDSEGIPGRLYRFDPLEGTTTVADHGPFTDSNGLGWSPDETTFYFTDSLVNIIYAYDYTDGELSNRRVFANTLELGYSEDTFPDGLCVDEDGGVWSARWGGSKLIRFTKDGTVDLEVYFPTALNITACSFGGPANDKLYVTTAHCGAIGGDSSRQERWPDSGHLFEVDLEGRYRGTKRHNFAG